VLVFRIAWSPFIRGGCGTSETVEKSVRPASGQHQEANLGEVRANSGDVDQSWPQAEHHLVVSELELIRARGVSRLRDVSVPRLAAIATRLYPAEEQARGIETLLRSGLAKLGTGDIKELAAISFGLADGLRGTRPSDLRKQAAAHRGVSPDTYRKGDERVLIADLAAGILAVVADSGASDVIDHGAFTIDPIQREYQAALLHMPEHDVEERRHFVDPITLYPFLVDRAESLVATDRTLDIIGMTLYTAWTTLKFWILRPETIDWSVRLAAVLDLEDRMTHWIPEGWREEADMYLADVVETSELRDVIARRVQLRAYAYDFVPTVHGYRLGNGDLFISFLKWQDDNRLGMRGYTYEFIPGTERSVSARAFRDLFDSWFERAIKFGQFTRNEHSPHK
jgi:hypothetical protein